MEKLENVSTMINKILQNDFVININVLYGLLNSNNPTEEETNKLLMFLSEYLVINDFKLNHIGQIPDDLAMKINYYLDQTTYLINTCYTEPATKAKMILLNSIEKYMNDNNQSMSNSKSRVRLKDGISYYDYSPDNFDDYNRVSGFANTLLILAGTIILGILLAVIII